MRGSLEWSASEVDFPQNPDEMESVVTRTRLKLQPELN